MKLIPHTEKKQKILSTLVPHSDIMPALRSMVSVCSIITLLPPQRPGIPISIKSPVLHLSDATDLCIVGISNRVNTTRELQHTSVIENGYLHPQNGGYTRKSLVP